MVSPLTVASTWSRLAGRAGAEGLAAAFPAWPGLGAWAPATAASPTRIEAIEAVRANCRIGTHLPDDFWANSLIRRWSPRDPNDRIISTPTSPAERISRPVDRSGPRG